MKTQYYYCVNLSLLLLGSLNGYGLFYMFLGMTSTGRMIFHQHSCAIGNPSRHQITQGENPSASTWDLH